MSFLAAFFAKITGHVIKSGSETVKTIVEIPKVIVETKKATLEVQKLEDEKEEKGNRIVTPTWQDVEKYDPKVRVLNRIAEKKSMEQWGMEQRGSILN